MEGEYDFSLHMAKFRNLYEAPVAGAHADPGSALTRAFQELGLRFESRKGPLDILVIDRVERKPVDN